MVTIKIIFIYILLTKSSLASNNCTDETPWLCNFEETLDEEENDNFARIHDDDDVDYQNIKHDISEIGGRIPEEFDARKAWPYCKSISTILNQGMCNTCWAISSAMVMSDRTCIATGGRQQALLSPHDIVTCCEDCTKVPKFCDIGGDVYNAFGYFIKTGVVSSKCQPYSTKKLQGSNVSCQRSCSNRTINYSKDKHRGSYIVKPTSSTNITDVLIEVMKSGPLSVFIENVSDSFSQDYRGGVYIDDQKFKESVSHAVRLIGWGTEEGIPYWLVANSWGTNWGDKGFFKIRRGTNELGIEKNCLAVGIKPLKNQNIDFGEEVVGHHQSSSQYIQPWKFILRVYLMYRLTKLFFIY